MPERFRKVTIVGLGLIGGSLGAALKRRRAADCVTGVDNDPEALRLALELEAVDESTANMASALQGAELVVLAVPVHTFPEVLPQLCPQLEPGTVLTDVASVKSEIARQVRACLPEEAVYVGGHPMAGSERRGIASADPYLFENAAYVICAGEDDNAAGPVKSLVDWVGAQPVYLTEELHDLLVAHVSHLPHLLASALVLSAAGMQEEGAWRLAAGGFRDMTRIAAGDPYLWTGICGANRQGISRAFSAYREQLDILQSWLESGEAEILEEFFRAARQLRASLPAKGGLLPEIHDLVVALPDKPGEIGRVCTLLGEHGVNIADLGILLVREGDGGTLRIVFYSRDGVEEAGRVLTRAGYKVFGLRERR